MTALLGSEMFSAGGWKGQCSLDLGGVATRGDRAVAEELIEPRGHAVVIQTSGRNSWRHELETHQRGGSLYVYPILGRHSRANHVRMVVAIPIVRLIVA